MNAPRSALNVLAGAALLVGTPALCVPAPVSAAPAAPAAPALPPSRDERVAQALLAAQEAAGSADPAALGDALRVIDRSGARPMEGWTGADPVPAWRALVPEAAGSPLRGSPLGPGYRSGQIGAGKSDSFQQVFLSGRKASIALSAVGGEPLSLRVVDADHKPVCLADAQRRACRWVPVFTQRYLIEVRNGGQSQANYFLVVD
jgi:hypothetical protein